MKLITALFFVLATTSVFANNVKITSFVYVRNSTTLAGVDGKFCVVVMTYNGQAEASHFGDKKVSVANLK
jgi:hypothetical protein